MLRRIDGWLLSERSLALTAIIVHNGSDFTQIAVIQIISHDLQFTEMFKTAPSYCMPAYYATPSERMCVLC
jgi:hypothetical protein